MLKKNFSSANGDYYCVVQLHYISDIDDRHWMTDYYMNLKNFKTKKEALESCIEMIKKEIEKIE